MANLFIHKNVTFFLAKVLESDHTPTIESPFSKDFQAILSLIAKWILLSPTNFPKLFANQLIALMSVPL